MMTPETIEKDIKKAELEMRLSDQETAMKKVKLELMRLKKREMELKETETSIHKAIGETNEMISKL